MPAFTPTLSLPNPAVLMCDEIARGGFFTCLMIDGLGNERLGFEPTVPEAEVGVSVETIAHLGEMFRTSENFRENMTAYLRQVGAVYSMPLAGEPKPYLEVAA